jgi:hypothetical protein
MAQSSAETFSCGILARPAIKAARSSTEPLAKYSMVATMSFSFQGLLQVWNRSSKITLQHV